MQLPLVSCSKKCNPFSPFLLALACLAAFLGADPSPPPQPAVQQQPVFYQQQQQPQMLQPLPPQQQQQYSASVAQQPGGQAAFGGTYPPQVQVQQQPGQPPDAQVVAKAKQMVAFAREKILPVRGESLRMWRPPRSAARPQLRVVVGPRGPDASAPPRPAAAPRPIEP